VHELINTFKIIKAGGNHLLEKFADSPWAMLKALKPTHRWQPWKFTRIPKSWKPVEQAPGESISRELREIAEDLATEFDVKQLSDWYRVSRGQIRLTKYRYLIQHLGGLANLLSRVYPDHPWQLAAFSHRSKKALQRQLSGNLTRLYPHDGTCLLLNWVYR